MGHQPKLLTPESVALIYSPIQSWTLSPGQEAALWNAFGDGGREGWDLMRVGYLLLLSPTISLPYVTSPEQGIMDPLLPSSPSRPSPLPRESL